MKVFQKWDKEPESVGQMYLAVVDGKAGTPTGDLERAKKEAERMVTMGMLMKRKVTRTAILVYDTVLLGYQENCEWQDRIERKERMEYERLKAKFEREEL